MSDLDNDLERLLLSIAALCIAVVVVAWVISFLLAALTSITTAFVLLVDVLFGAYWVPELAFIPWFIGGAAIDGSVAFYYVSPMLGHRSGRTWLAGISVLLSLAFLIVAGFR